MTLREFINELGQVPERFLDKPLDVYVESGNLSGMFEPRSPVFEDHLNGETDEAVCISVREAK